MNAAFYGVMNNEARKIEHFCLRCGANCIIEKEDAELSKVTIFNFNDEIILTTCMGDDLILTSASNQMNVVVESVNFERLTLI